ncbi:MAG: YabP/YqfC family sporulation protein [Clostridia bacterium]|nr:YabP/YqfC family sporulation protein [Clostridia bacterium]
MADNLIKDMTSPRVQLYGQNWAVIEGFLSIRRFEKEVIELVCRRYDIIIHGFDMEMREKSRGYIEVRGTILSVSVEGSHD